MAPPKRRRRGSRLYLAVRLLGVLGLFAALVGLIALSTSFNLASRADWEAALTDLSQQRFGDHFRTAGLGLVLVGGVLFLFSLFVQTAAGLRTIAGRRNAAATNAVIQVGLAVALLVGVNLYSFRHYLRCDWTRSHQFTLPPEIAKELRELRSPTTVVVYQRHKTFGTLSEKPDAYDYAAERKVVEKVQDLVNLFREFGPQFRVVVLDVEAEGYDKTLESLTKDAPGLRKAIDAAPDNSIFFESRQPVKLPDGSAGERESVQRLSFNDFYQLDKTASKEADGGRGNLVLLPQGVGPFARKVLSIEEKRPKVGIAVIHEWLTTEGLDEFSLAGVRKSLTAQGFDVADVVLKKKWGEGEPEPAAYSLGESKYERLEEELAETEAALQINRRELDTVSGLLDKLKTLPLAELNKMLRDQLRGRTMNEESRRLNVARLEPAVEALHEIIPQQEKERADLQKQLQEMPDQERIQEDRRQTDVQAKLTRLLSECDLLIVPRMTLRNLIVGDRIPARLYRLDDAQVQAVKAFLKSGKPVFACFGPTNEPADRRAMGPTGPDGLEDLLGQLGIQFGGETVLFNVEGKAFAERRSSLLASGADVKVPPVLFDVPPAVRTRRGGSLADEEAAGPAKPNPISESMRIVASSTGSREKLEDLRLKHPRPIYFVPLRGNAPAYAAEFLFSDRESWNEKEPFPSRERTPRYEPPKPDDPARGTREEERRGPFPLGVAVQTTVPAEWYRPELGAFKAAELLTASDESAGAPLALAAEGLLPADVYAPKDYKPTAVRVAAVGHGGLFVGPELSPAKDKLLVNTCNWLLGREERLPHADLPPWSYPRVELSPRRQKLWFWGTLVALPAFFLFLGQMVLLVRRYR